MQFSLSLLLLIYYFFILVFLLFSFFNLYHIIKFGVANPITVFIFFLYIAGLVFILFVSWCFIKQIDWSYQIDINNFLNSYQLQT